MPLTMLKVIITDSELTPFPFMEEMIQVLSTKLNSQSMMCFICFEAAGGGGGGGCFNRL